MKKNYLLSVLLILCIGLGVSACSDDDEDNDNGAGSKNGNELLIGKWEQRENVHWTFDGKYLLIEDKEDIMNGEKTVYSYDEKSQNLEVGGGFIVYKVTTLTDKELKISSIGSFIRCIEHK